MERNLPKTPISVDLEISKTCNACGRSHYPAGHETRSEQMPLANVDLYLKKLVSAEVMRVNLVGDALAHKDFFQIATSVRKLGMAVSFESNLAGLDSRLAFASSGLVDEVIVESCCLTPEGLPKDDSQFGKIGLLLDSGVSVTLTADTAQASAPLFQHAVSEVSKRQIRSYPGRFGLGLTRSNAFTAVDKAEGLGVVEAIKEYRRMGVWAFLVDAPLPFCAVSDMYYLEGADMRTCRCSSHLVFVTTDGSIYPCRYLGHQLGDLHHDDLSQVWRGAKFGQVRQSLIAAECTDCRWITQCLSGCPGKAVGVQTKDPLIPANCVSEVQGQTAFSERAYRAREVT